MRPSVGEAPIKQVDRGGGSAGRCARASIVSTRTSFSLRPVRFRSLATVDSGRPPPTEAGGFAANGARPA
jgi:hypothetical protein